MQTNNFIKYISDAQAVSSITQIEASSLVKEFPYCQSGQILLAIYLNQNNHLLFEQQLKKSAIYSSDRKRLFDLISSTHHEVELEEKESMAVVEEIEEPEKLTEKPVPVIELVEQPKETIVPKIIESVEENTKDEKDRTLELEYINEAISSSYSLELEVNLIEDETSSETDNNSIENTPTEIDENAEFTFSDWLKHMPTAAKTEEKEKKQTHKNINLDLIDKFIQEDPKIKPKKTEFYSPVNMARLSVVDDSDLVSETLALIQVEQGNLETAIKTYQKLSLKNPEKRTYFANQIKILKQKIK